MMKYSIISNFLSLSLLAIFFGFYIHDNRKVGYVDNSKLLIKYKGYLEAQDDYKEKEKNWNSNLDTLEHELKIAFTSFQGKKESLTREEILREEQLLQYRKNNYLRAKEKSVSNLQLENDRLMEVVSNQIESFINKYAEQRGYDLIIGITDQGNVLYSDMDKNITEDLLVGLNGSYEGI